MINISKNRIWVIAVGLPSEDLEAFNELKQFHSKFSFLQIQNIEDLPGSLNFTTFPIVVVFKEGHFLSSFEGNAYLLQAHEYLEKLNEPVATSYLSKEQLHDFLLYNKNIVILNGSLEYPLDEESKLISQKISHLGITFSSLDIKDLSDDRQIEIFSFFSNGEVVLKSYESFSSLKDADLLALFKQPISKRLEKLIKLDPIMIFLKGDKYEQKCGFSKQIISLMCEYCPDRLDGFETFNILKDEEVRSELKTFSNWPTYPQLYVKGELVGGLDICKELVANNEFVDTLTL